MTWQEHAVKKDNPLPKLTFNFQISFLLHLDEAFHILYKPLPLSVWMKQLPLYTIACKTQIVLIFWNILKAASWSCYIIVAVKIFELLSKQPPYLIKNLPKITQSFK